MKIYQIGSSYVLTTNSGLLYNTIMVNNPVMAMEQVIGLHTSMDRERTIPQSSMAEWRRDDGGMIDWCVPAGHQDPLHNRGRGRQGDV